MTEERDTTADVRLERIVSLRLVPTEPTKEMLEAASVPLRRVNDILGMYQVRAGVTMTLSDDDNPPLYHAWKAMLAAAPMIEDERDARMNWIAGCLRDNVSRLEDVVWDIEQLENWKTDMRLLGIHEVVAQTLASLNALREQANAQIQRAP